MYIFISPSGSKQIIKQLSHNINASESTAISNQKLNINCFFIYRYGRDILCLAHRYNNIVLISKYHIFKNFAVCCTN